MLSGNLWSCLYALWCPALQETTWHWQLWKREKHFDIKFQRFSCFAGGFYFHRVGTEAERTYQGGWLGTSEWRWWEGWAGTWTCPFQVLTQEWGNGFGSIRPGREAQRGKSMNNKNSLNMSFLWSQRETFGLFVVLSSSILLKGTNV